MKVLSPFGPKIAIVKIPKKIINNINLEVDRIISDKKRLKKSDYSKKLVGQVMQEIKLDNKFIKKNLLKFVKDNIKKYIKQSSKRNVQKISLKSLWVVRQFKNEYNPSHWHNGHVSGVGYLKVPSNLGETLQKDKSTNNNGKLEMVHGSKAFLCKPTFRVTPKVGDFYFFPHYLMHAVYPFFDSDEERRSVSFNATVDQSLFNE